MLCNGSGNGVRKWQQLMGTAKWQQKNGNRMVETGHSFVRRVQQMTLSYLKAKYTGRQTPFNWN